ncbi:MAG: DHH family phosphoesterase [Nanoarchaeota archaeon]|nr:hypothetical protein [Nanoarchaeota archaeon]
MLSKNQILEIRQYLEKAQNPLFFFDNDADGLCSFLLLARYSGKGKGVAIKSFPDLNKSYTRKLYELNPDYIFILDKPIVSEEFIDEARKLNIPIIWIDHHELSQEISEGVNYYNPLNGNKKSSEPVTYLCWKISEKKDDLWIAMVGCIGDGFFPSFVKDFREKYPEFWKENITFPFQAVYETKIGKVVRILNFALKDRTSNVVKMIKFLLKTRSPDEILTEEPNNSMLVRFNYINKKYRKLIDSVKNVSKNKIIYFEYGGEFSLSADISNELSYRFPGKTIVVVYIKGNKANISLRGENVKELTEKAIKGLENATGGGHEYATGAKVGLDDLPKFKERIMRFVGN